MADFNKILDAGDVETGIINTVVEIPKWSTLKIEWHRDLGIFELDRVEPNILQSQLITDLYHRHWTKMVTN